MDERKNGADFPTTDTIVKDLKKAIAGLDYGTVTIKVHNAKIVQIEITQKKRFDSGIFEKGGGI